MPKVLNEPLYEQLRKVFGSVKIANQGLAFRGRVIKSVMYKMGEKVQVQQAGEYYCVCCPVCGDTRHRLWINHRWGTKLNYKTWLHHLVVCYNEGCESVEGFRKTLYTMVSKGSSIALDRVEVAQGAYMPAIKTIDMVGRTVRVDRLPEYHPAVRYLRDVRHLSVAELGANWDVCWVEFSTVLPAQNRLFFPYYDIDEVGERIFIGGQAHWLDRSNLNGTPHKGSGEAKWYTVPGTQKSQHLFNGWRARKQSKLVVIVEGPFDAITLGPEFSVALFGHTVSFRQKQLLEENWMCKGGRGILALDADVAEDADVKEVEAWLGTWPKHTILRLPENKDIGDYTRDAAWQQIAEAGGLEDI